MIGRDRVQRVAAANGLPSAAICVSWWPSSFRSKKSLAEAEAVARRAQTPGTLGMILRVRGRIDGPSVAAEA